LPGMGLYGRRSTPSTAGVVFAAYAAVVLAYARRRTDSATADDVLGEVFVIAWRRLEQIPPEPAPWLLACARHVLLTPAAVSIGGRR
jgi:DNA-directed RNA polymerase specialized sigma24 family protein